jgi:hypothetical protein
MINKVKYEFPETNIFYSINFSKKIDLNYGSYNLKEAYSMLNDLGEGYILAVDLKNNQIIDYEKYENVF